jgi:hypothetical protein
MHVRTYVYNPGSTQETFINDCHTKHMQRYGLGAILFDVLSSRTTWLGAKKEPRLPQRLKQYFTEDQRTYVRTYVQKVTDLNGSQKSTPQCTEYSTCMCRRFSTYVRTYICAYLNLHWTYGFYIY